MKNTFYFMLGIALVILTSATTASVMTVKPAKPIKVLVKAMILQHDSEEAAEYIKEKIRSGYILKLVSVANDGQYMSSWIVVMEKY